MATEEIHPQGALWQELLQEQGLTEAKQRVESYPKVSIIIPTINVGHLISLTLDKVLSQSYPDFEVIIVDCSTDRTLDVIRGYRSDRIRIYSTNCNVRYEMLNIGISKASGFYVNFLFPGDFYIYYRTLHYMMELANKQDLPHIVFCGTLLRDTESDVKTLYRKLSLDLLKRGQQPTSLQSCWFRLDALKEVGLFNPNYELRGGYDLMCRFAIQKEFRFASLHRILIDYDLRSVTRRMVAIHSRETILTIYRHFGILAAIRWLFIQRELRRIVKLWIRGLKAAFS